MRVEKKEAVKVNAINSFETQKIFSPLLSYSVFAFSILQGEQFVFHEDWGEALVSKSCPVLCVLDIEGDNVSVLEGVPEDISPGQVGTSTFAMTHVLMHF